MGRFVFFLVCFSFYFNNQLLLSQSEGNNSYLVASKQLLRKKNLLFQYNTSTVLNSSPRALIVKYPQSSNLIGWINIGGSSNNPETRFISGFDPNYDYIANQVSFWDKIIAEKIIPLNRIFSTVHLHNPFGLPSNIHDQGIHMEFNQVLTSNEQFSYQLSYGFLESFNRYLASDRSRKLTFYVGGPHFWTELNASYNGGSLLDAVNESARLQVDAALALFIELASNNSQQVSLGLDNTGSKLEGTIAHAVYTYLRDLRLFDYIYLEAVPKLASFSFTDYNAEVSFLGILKTVFNNQNPARRPAAKGIYPYHSYFIEEAEEVNSVHKNYQPAPVLLARNPVDYDYDMELFTLAAMEGYRFAFGIMALRDILGINWFGDLRREHGEVLHNMLYGEGHMLAFRIPRPKGLAWDDNSVKAVVNCPGLFVKNFPYTGADPYAFIAIRSRIQQEFNCDYHYVAVNGKISAEASLTLQY